jgi:hypothetical protein
MRRTSRAIWIVAGILILAAIAWWLASARGPTESNPAAPEAKVAAPSPKAQPELRPTLPAHPAALPTKTTPAPSGASAATSGTRTELTPPRGHADSSGYWVPPPNTQLRDRRADAGPHAAREREAVGYALDTLDDDIESCLAEWRKSDTSMTGSLMLSIEIDPKGVQKAYVDVDGGVPLGPQSCFANAVYGIDWSHMVDSPAKITRPYSFDQDGGA